MTLLRYLISGFTALILAGIFFCSCDEKSTWEEYADWRELNTNYYQQEISRLDDNGNKYYQTVIPEWNKGAAILMHFYNDRSLTSGNLYPLYTSTCQVIYKGELYDGRMFDNSYSRQDSIFTCTPGEVIPGWGIALTFMRVGDSCRVVIPYGLAYGHQDPKNSIIQPYSTLVFDIKLVNIPYYEIKD